MDYIRWGGGTFSRTQMEGLRFELCHPLPERSVTQAYSRIAAAHDELWCFLKKKKKKSRQDAITSYPLQQINRMLFSPDVQGKVLILWQAEAISEVLHFKGRRWKVVKLEDMCSLGFGPGWLKALSPQTEPRIKRTESLLSPGRSVCCWRLERDGWKWHDWKKVKYLMGTLVTMWQARSKCIIKCKESCFSDRRR